MFSDRLEKNAREKRIRCRVIRVASPQEIGESLTALLLRLPAKVCGLLRQLGRTIRLDKRKQRWQLLHRGVHI